MCYDFSSILTFLFGLFWGRLEWLCWDVWCRVFGLIITFLNMGTVLDELFQ